MVINLKSSTATITAQSLYAISHEKTYFAKHALPIVHEATYHYTACAVLVDARKSKDPFLQLECNPM